LAKWKEVWPHEQEPINSFHSSLTSLNQEFILSLLGKANLSEECGEGRSLVAGFHPTGVRASLFL